MSVQRRSHAWAGWRDRLPIIGVLVLIAAFSLYMAGSMDSGRLSPDGVENVGLSYHLWTAGTISEDGSAPSYLREPLPIAITAAHMAWLTDIPASAAHEDLIRNDHYLGQILLVNVYYLVGLLFAVWWLSWMLSGSHLVSALAIVGTMVFSRVMHHSGNLLTETLAALTLTVACASMVWLVKNKGLPAAVLAGFTMGALALTKAAALYVALVAIPGLILCLVLFRLVTRRRALLLLTATAVSFVLTVAPWMTRNLLHFDEFALAQRGGVVLYTRALKDQMTAVEYGGTFYAYAPPELRKHVFEGILGFSPKDLSPDGRYARLVRYPPGEERLALAGEVERTSSFFGRAWATKVRLDREMAAAGAPPGEADRVLQKRATELIAASPARHLALTLPFAWRGIWAFEGRTLAAQLANLLAFGILLAFPIIAVWRRRPEWLAFSLLPVGMFWFHALLTHFIPRYSEPLVPLAVVSALLVLQCAAARVPWGALMERFKPSWRTA